MESDFTKPPDYLPLGKMQKWGWEMLMFLDLRFMFFDVCWWKNAGMFFLYVWRLTSLETGKNEQQ